MTVPTLNSEASFVTNGVTTNFPFYFKFLVNEDLVVTYVSPQGVSSVLSLGSQYTVNGAGNDGGGSITTTVALSGPGQLVVSREMDAYQLTSLRNQGKFLAETHEDVFDRLTMLIQQGLSIFKRALMRPLGRDYFYAEDRRITSVKDPEELQDAATLGWSSRFIANLISAIQGPINNALNIFYKAPNGTSHVVQDMAIAGTENGSALIYHEGGTVRTALIQNAADIDALEVKVAATESDISKLKIGPTKSHSSVNGFLIAQNPWGVRCLNVLGDSISFGANCQNIERDSYVGILKKMLNIEFGTDNIGALNIIPQTSNADGTYSQYFSAASSQTGTWTSLQDAAATHIPFGYALQSSVAGSTQNFIAPLSQRVMRVWYDGTVTGAIEVVVGGTVVLTINTNGTGTGYDVSSTIDLTTVQAATVAGNQGTVTFTLRCKSGVIRLTGLNFTNDSTGNTFRVHNFSRDGRSGRYVSQDVIDKTTAGCYAFIWALGTNDVTGYDAAAQVAFDQRIDWIIAAAATNRTRVVFIDFLFGQPYSHGLRASLRRGAAAIPNSIFIDVEQLWTVSGVQYTEAERVSRNLSSGVHPEEVGHRLVAETLAQRLGLVCTSKKQAILDDPIWKSLDISASGLKNRLNVAGQMCAYRIRDNQIEVVMDTATVPAAVTTIGTIPPADFPPINGFNFASNPDATGKFGLFTVSGSGAVIYRPNPESSAAPNACQLNVALPYRQSYSWP